MYIRTRCGVYEVKEDCAGFYEVLFEKVILKPITKDSVIKEADSIDELCDCFVIEWLPTNHKDIFTIDKYSKGVVKSCIGNKDTKVYGAIWTNEGLIYAAELNEEGVWKQLL